MKIQNLLNQNFFKENNNNSTKESLHKINEQLFQIF